MKRIILVCLLICMVFALGCTAARKGLVGISEQELKNAETAREVAQNYLEIWPIQSGFIRGALGARMDELPAQVISAMDELDQLSSQYADPNDCPDYDLGLSLGLRVRLLSSVVAEGLKYYMPEALDFVPLLF